jgi:feruloyl-CoA synthase
MSEQIRDVRLGRLAVAVDRRADGSMVVRSTEAMPPVADKLTARLQHWAAVAPNRTFLAQRDATGDWQRLSYADALYSVRSIARSLLDRNVSAEHPVAILSGNGMDHALMALACMMVGVPYAPVSVAYSLISSDHEKLRTIMAQLTPGLVFVSHANPFAKAIAACCPPTLEVVAAQGTLTDRTVTPLVHLLDRQDVAGPVDAAHALVGPSTVAKILFTSGSTGNPKGVINTQGMLCANQAMLQHWLAFVTDTPPVLVDWLPWSHTFGGNHNFGLVLNNGGTLYIDDGKPTPAGMAQSVRNLREIAPTIYFNVPKGYEELVGWLRREPELRRRFFSELSLVFYSGASLPPHIAKEFDDLAIETTGKRILFVTSLGSTETAPAALSSTKETARPGVVGLPLPGVELKLLPSGDKLEARLKGPNIMPGYWRDATQTAKAFDADGFYMLGDALKFAIPGDAAGGFVFDGRVAEDFKLITGTWVSVGPLRGRLISAFAPLVRDCVIAGHDRNDITALVFPDLEGCRTLLPTTERTLSDQALAAHPTVRAAFAKHLVAFNGGGAGSSMRVARLTLLDELPSIDAGEMTDKGSINQRAVLARRATLVDELYAATPSPRVIS